MNRILIGVIGLMSLTIGTILYFFVPGANLVTAAIAMRVGAILCVIWLALPQLQFLRGRSSGLVIPLALAGVLIIAARGNTGKVIVAIAVIAISVSGVLKWLSQIANNDSKKTGS